MIINSMRAGSGSDRTVALLPPRPPRGARTGDIAWGWGGVTAPVGTLDPVPSAVSPVPVRPGTVPIPGPLFGVTASGDT